MRGELDVLVVILGGAEMARDDARAVEALEVAEHEPVARLRLVILALRQAEMSRPIFVPRMAFEERVLVIRPWLGLAPIALRDVATRVDEVFGMRYGTSIDAVIRHFVSG